MDFIVQEAKRELIYVKIALMAPSGGGKTFGGLRLATGMLTKMKDMGLDIGNGKILMGNTEGPRGRYYANEFKYDIVDLSYPHNPEKYVEFIEWAEKSNYPILLLDSSSHEWEGRGGCLDLHQQAGGTFQSWGKVTPRHDKFIEAMAYSKLHLIATMRGKDAYEIEKGENGKSNVKKLGVGAQQRNGFEFEFTSTFLIDQKSNMATSQKDNTHLFENEGEVKLSEDYGKKLIEWANSGNGFTDFIKKHETETDVLNSLHESIIAKVKELGGSTNKSLEVVMNEFSAKNAKDIKSLSLENSQKLFDKINIL